MELFADSSRTRVHSKAVGIRMGTSAVGSALSANLVATPTFVDPFW